MAEHARLSPSSAHRWMNCPGSVRAEEGYPDETSQYAAEGTAAHHVLLDLALPLGIEPHYFVGKVIPVEGFKIEVTMEMADHLLFAFDEISEIPGEHYYETRVSLDKWLPGQFGTADVGILTDEFVMVRDLKYGQGVPVHPERNEQMMMYMLGFCAHLNAKGVKIGDRRLILVVDQPRCPGGGGQWEFTLEELLEFGREVRAAGEATYAKNAPRNPGGKTCQWCKAKAECNALAEHCLNLASLEFDDLDFGDELDALPDPEKLSLKRRRTILKNETLFKNWLDELHSLALRDALAGRPSGGFKAVLGRKGRRTWRDEDEAAAYAESKKIDPWQEPKLKSPTDVENEIKSKHKGRGNTKARKAAIAELSDYWTQGEAKPVLVDEDHPSPPVLGALGLFDDLNDD